MDIINRRSATTLLICVLAGVGFVMDGGKRTDRPASPPVAGPAAVPAPAASAASAPARADIPDVPPVWQDDQVRRPAAPSAAPADRPAHSEGSAQPAVGQGIRLPSSPLPDDGRAAAQRALAEDLDAMLS